MNYILEDQEFHFAFSFAGEERKFVEQIYTKLEELNYSVFYDIAYQAQLLGQDLYTGLRDMYKNKGKYVVCFISEAYTKGVWTNLEFSAIKERLMSTFFAGDFLIPILIGNIQMLEDIPSYIGFYRHKSVDETVKMLVEKIKKNTFEDNFQSNINHFISHLCDQIYKSLESKNIETTIKNNNEISVSKHFRSFSLLLAPDPSAQVPCILVNKYDPHHKKTAAADGFPMFIITWKRQKNLYFSIHEFDGDAVSPVRELSFHDIIDYFHTFIQNSLGD